ncbi:MAG: replication initiator protein A [Oscillibacter sp.]|nr:replication initiator protein A [Oscillibacter sp.]
MKKPAYFYSAPAAPFSFFRLPKALFTAERYQTLSLPAKALYGLLLDRMCLSAQNGWTETDGRVYIYFTQKTVQEYLLCSHNKATAYFRELEGVGLIERKRQGLGRPAKIYVLDFSAGMDSGNETGNGAVQEGEKRVQATEQNVPSRRHEKGALDSTQAGANETEKNQKEKNDTETSSPLPPPRGEKRSPFRKRQQDERDWIREEIRENIAYDVLLSSRPEDRGLVDSCVELMTEACCTSRETLRVCGEDMPAGAVRRRFLEMEWPHMDYALDCLKRTTAKIGSIKAYTLTTLYNAPVTMESYYDALVRRDWAFA